MALLIDELWHSSSRTNGLHHRGLMAFIHRGLMASINEGYSYVRHPPSASTCIASHREIHPRHREREEEGEMRRGGAQAAAVAKRKPRPTLSANRMVPGPRFPLVRFDLRRFEPGIRVLTNGPFCAFSFRVRRSSRRRLPRQHHKQHPDFTSLRRPARVTRSGYVRLTCSSATRQRLTKCLTKAPSREHHDHRCHIVIGALRKRRLAQRLRRIVCASSLGQHADH